MSEPRALATRPLLVVDGDNLAHRAYHSVPKTVRGRDGQPINAIVGWVNVILVAWDAEAPRAVFVAWDTLGVPTYRHELWPAYQAGRVFDEALVRQLEQLPQVCAAFGFGVGKRAGYEADDLMAAAARAEAAAGGYSLVLTADRDAYQLVSDAVTLLAPQRGGGAPLRITPEMVVRRLGVRPEQVPDFKALAGDSSDNIPGARGIGPRSAATLLQRYGTLERALEAGAVKVADGGEQLIAFREIVRARDVEVELPPTRDPDWVRAAATLRKLGADTLAGRLEQRAQTCLRRTAE